MADVGGPGAAALPDTDVKTDLQTLLELLDLEEIGDGVYRGCIHARWAAALSAANFSHKR